MLRHERQTVAMELAAALHHSRDAGPGMHVGPRAQKTASSGQRHSVLMEPEPPHGEGQSRSVTWLPQCRLWRAIVSLEMMASTTAQSASFSSSRLP